MAAADRQRYRNARQETTSFGCRFFLYCCLVNYERKKEYLGRGAQKMYEIFIKKFERSFFPLVEISKMLWYTVF